MNQNRPARWLFIQTGAASALVALLVAFGLDLEWAAVFALGALFGTLNWYLLGVILIELTSKERKRPMVVPAALTAKMLFLLVGLFVVLPPVAHQAVAFLCGFSMFLILVAFQAIGQLLFHLVNPSTPSGPGPRVLGTLPMGTRTDA